MQKLKSLSRKHVTNLWTVLETAQFKKKTLPTVFYMWAVWRDINFLAKSASVSSYTRTEHMAPYY